MAWWDFLPDWLTDEEAAAPQQGPAARPAAPVDPEAQRAQQLMQRWRATAAPSVPVGPTAARDPLEAALSQWQQGPAARPTGPVQGPQPRPPVNPWQAAVDQFQAPQQQGPQPRPPSNPWQAAVDEWQAPPQLERPFAGYDVPGAAPLDYAVDRPDTGAAPLSGPSLSPTVQSEIQPFDPNMGPLEQGRGWGVSRFGGGNQAVINPTVALGPGGAVMGGVYDALGELPGAINESLQGGPDLGMGGMLRGSPPVKWLEGFGRDALEYGPVDAALMAIGGPGYDYLKQFNADRKEEGSNTGLNNFADNAWTALTALDVPRKAIENVSIPGSGALLGGNKENVTVGQAAAAVGTALNQTLNPFNPNQVDLSYLDLAKDLFNGGPNVARSIITSSLSASQQINETFANLPPELRTEANIALVNQISGPERLETTLDTIVNQDTMVASMEQAAQMMAQRADQLEAMDETQQAQDARLAAAQYGKAANDLKNKSAADIVDDNANPWAELVSGILLDPLNISLAPGQEAIQAAKSSALMNMKPEEALKALDAVLDDTTKQMVGADVAGWWGKVNPFARTADTKAHMATDTLWRAATNILSDVTSKEQAKALIDVWTGDPRRLVEGVVMPGSTEISKWGPGVVANPELLQQYPVLVKARDALLNMRSLTGDPATFSPQEFFAELNDVLYKSSRDLFGLKTLDDLPAGATNYRVTRTSTGTSVIEYVDKKGQVLKTSKEMLPYDAELQAKQLKKAITTAGPGGLGNPALAVWGLQKAILSDFYLGMSPGYWIKNATSAATTLLTDNTMTLLPTKAIMNDFMTKFGAAPTTRSGEAMGSALGQAAGEVLGGEHWAERLFGGNPIAKGYSSLMKRLYSIPFGATDIAGRIPFGEQNFALRATYVPFKRYLTSQWTDAAKTFETTIAGMGIDPAIARSLASTVADVGINGNKQQLATVLRTLTGKQTIPFSLKELGVPDELISAEGWAKLNTLLSESLPNQLDEAAAQVRQIFGAEFKSAGELLNSAPPQPGRYVWTEAEAVADGADVIDSMTEAAKRAGIDATQARQQAQQLMSTVAQAEKALWSTVRGDLAGATDPQSLNVAMDLLAKWYDWRKAARMQTDELGRIAVQTNTTAAWAKKFEGTNQIYGAFPQWFQTTVDEARQNLLKLSNGQQVDGAYDWFDVIKRYAAYDEAEVQAARTAGMGLGSPQMAGETYVKALDANRKYVDKSVVELFSAFRRYPNQTSLDLMADGVRKMEELGAKAASFLAAKRTEMLPKKADAYYQLRNQVWAEFFDNAVVHNNVVKRLIVASGVADMAKGALKWTDEFAGGEFQLVGKLADGYWQARNLATGAVERFADPVAIEQAKRANKVVVSSMPTVPLKVLQDFYTVIGENSNIVNKLIEELDAESAAKWAAQEAEAMRLLDEPVRTPSMRWVGPDPNQELAAQAAEAAAGSRDARLALRDEWDRVAKASGGFPKLDQVVATYTRQGVVNVPENLFEDLYGQTIGGRVLSNQSDVERFLQEYYDLGQQAKRAPEVIPTALPAQVADGFTPTPLEADFGAGFGQAIGTLIDQLQALHETPTTLARSASGWNPWGVGGTGATDLHKLISGINNNLTNLFGKKAPEVGEVAQHTIRTLNDAERRIIQRLPEILQGKPNTLTPAQQLRIIDTLQEMLPQYDNILAGAVRTGEQMANFAMLNYGDKRNLDVWAASLMPYHYFWSRSAKNWLQRAVQKPAVVNMWYESERAIERENEQNNIPQHLQGTLPFKSVFGVGPDRIGNPLTFALPFAMYLGSDFVNPDDARSELERWQMTVKKFTPALFPLADYAMKALLDQQAPKPGGQKRTAEFQLGDVLPLYKMAGYAYQAATGDMSWSQGPLGYGDEYDYGRAGKQVGLASLRGDVNPKDAMWAPDVGWQQQTGAKPLPEQSAGAAGAWQQGAQAAGWDRLINRASSFLTGVPSYSLSPEEQQMREMKETRVGLGYNEVSNPTGSKEAVNAYTNMQPDQFDATFNYGALYPQGDDRKRLRPGEKAVQTEYYQQHGIIMNEMTQAVAKFLIDNPNATSKEVNDLKSPYWDKVEELKAKYPSLPAKESKHLDTKYMNPVEHAAGFVQSVLSHKPEGKPVYPGKDASAEAKKQYYLDKAKWDTARLDYYDRQFTQLLNQDDGYPDPWKEAARKMIKDMYSSELLRGYENRYAGPVEKAWSDRQSFVEEVQDAEHKVNEKNVADRLGPEGNELLAQYYALPKGSEERKAFKQANPQVAQAILASYQPAEYDEFVKRFGPDAFAMVNGGPQHPGDGASEAQLQAYYKEAAAFNNQYPNAEAAKLWLNGRRFGAAEGSDSYGAAYEEAVAIFGPDIFNIMNNVPEGKDAFVAWMKSSPEEYMLYTGYKEWKKEYSETDKASYSATGTTPTETEETIIPNAGAGEGYTGPRPVGSERQALGTFDPYAGYGPSENPAGWPIPEGQIGWASAAQPAQPNKWANYSWDSLLDKPAANPWTQRGNELNAALLGDRPIPSTMAGMPESGGTSATAGGLSATDSATGSADLKTAREYAMQNDKYVKGEMTRKEWAARRGSVEGYFGAGGASMWDEYYNLPKGPAREEFMKANPVMRAINLYAYNKAELAPALQELGDDALGLWALTPAYADTPEAKAARSQYYDKNPKAFLFQSWLKGRPTADNEGADDPDGKPKYNFGADYNTAKEMFGPGIWDIVSQYKRGWDSTQKRLWHEKHPEYSAWSKWWYGNMPQREGAGTGAGRSGGGGLGGFGQRQEAPKRPLVVQQPTVYGQGMSGGLAEPARMGSYSAPRLDLDWLKAGQELRPGRAREWSPDWIRAIKK